ncbi:hypothetical protein [Ligilactobacillus salivarius]|uniref:hypothetical protein n=1 Tax=Ligilactobacillus salivarius TaxID=1624 RepID=UPI0009D9AC56|nr:hypothetical protein [Ligilactobacillus salivarius]OQR18780.1 hypothetical protein B6U39_09235 [Ligilactobacillus salivarius]
MGNLFEWDNSFDGNVIDDLDMNRLLTLGLSDYIKGDNELPDYMPAGYNTNKLSKLIVIDIVRAAELMSFDLNELAEGETLPKRVKSEKSLNYSLTDFVDKYKNVLYTADNEKDPCVMTKELFKTIGEELRGDGFKFTLNDKNNTFCVKWRVK